MSRRRYISTNTSTDKAFNTLGRQHGDFAAMLYLLMIPHAEDDGALTGEPEELLAKVVPMRRDKDVPDIVAALNAMDDLGLIVWDRANERVSFPAANFYKYQSYIPDNKRGTAKGEASEASSPQNAEEQRETARNSASPSPSPSLSLSPSPEEDAQPKKAVRPARGEHPAVLAFARAFKSVKGRPPARDAKMEARLSALWRDQGEESFARALVNFFGCLGGRDPYPQGEGFNMGLFVRQFDKWEGGQAEIAVPARASPNGLREGESALIRRSQEITDRMRLLESGGA